MMNRSPGVISARQNIVTVLISSLVSLLCFSGTADASIANGAPRDLTDLPDTLQKYVTGSPAWATSPWMSSPACKDKGGDYSLWVANVVADIPSIVSVFLAEVFSSLAAEHDRLRGAEIAKGFEKLSAEFRDLVPTGYCADDMKRWAGASPQYKPFGFAWGVTHRTPYLCVDDRTSGRRSDADNRWVGAERAACDGFFVACDNASSEERARCERWNAFSVQFTQRGKELRDAAISRYPARSAATYHTEVAWHWAALVGAVGVAGLAVLVVLTISRRRQRGDTPLASGSTDAAA